jgi:alpha-ribazole phosphatase/probable phosphoglycerate mutase
MALTLLRHAALHPMYQKRYIGWSDISIEMRLFRTQAFDIVRRIKFDEVYSSDLRRCTQTLTFASIHPFQTDERLREVRFKAHIEGKTFKEISTRNDFEQDLLNNERTWHTYVCAESYESFERRIVSFLNDIDFKNKEILVCSHSGTIRRMLHILGFSYAKALDYAECIRIEDGISTMA